MAKWTIQDLELIKKIVAQIDSGQSSFRKAAKQYNVTKYQIEKWTTYIHQWELGTAPPRLSNPPLPVPALEEPGATIEPLLKRRVIEDVYCGKLSKHRASKKYKVPVSVISVWLDKLPGYRSTVTTMYGANINAELKVQVVRAIQANAISEREAALRYKVSRFVINHWVDNYSIFNIDGSICYQTISTMTPDEQNKELLDQLTKLKAQLEHEKMKNEALQTLLQVAEEKFGIQIKKKRGPKPSKK